jgi:hypothetical protein
LRPPTGGCTIVSVWSRRSQPEVSQADVQLIMTFLMQMDAKLNRLVDELLEDEDGGEARDDG